MATQIQELAKLLKLPENCHKSLFIDFNFEFACLKILLSKILGYGIVAGSLIYKVPQIVKIIGGRSAKGLAISSFVLELIAFTISLIYNLRFAFPFSTWGEYVFMIIQTGIIVMLTAYFQKKINVLFVISTIGYGGFVYSLTNPSIVDDKLLTLLQTATIPIFIASRIPQIWTNFANKDVGQLSFLSTFMQVAGSAGRVFTTLQEVKDIVILSGFLIGTALNLTLFLQIIIYGSKKEKEVKKE